MFAYFKTKLPHFFVIFLVLAFPHNTGNRGTDRSPELAAWRYFYAKNNGTFFILIKENQDKIFDGDWLNLLNIN